jgi:hypothetical protein
MRPAEPKNEQSRLPEWLQISLALGAIALLFAACSGVPFFLSRSFGVGFGLAGAVIAVICWVYLVRPMPGFVQGIIALTGLFTLLTLLMGWIIRVIRYVSA